MCLIEFPYSNYKGTFVPVVPVQIKSNLIWYKIWAYVDSGATYSIFSLKDAEEMNLDLSNSVKRFIIVGDSSFIPANFIKIYMKICDVEFEAEIGFSEKLGIGFNLLGRKDIFNNFQICFNEKKKIITFQEINS